MPPTSDSLRSLRDAWAEALYGADGFYRQDAGPAGHFATSAQGLPGVDELLAECIVALASENDLHSIVEIGCGKGELLTLIAEREPGLDLLGVDIVDRPRHLDDRIGWLRSPGGAQLPAQLRGLGSVLVLAHEWLDVVPCEIATVTDGDLLTLAVTADGEPVAARPLSAQERRWVEDHWPVTSATEFVEIGSTRDAAYADLRSRIDNGLLVVVDYGHLRDARPDRTFVGYRSGVVCEPRFDTSTDLTAHVAMDSLGADLLMQQHDVAARWLQRPQPPEHSLATSAPLAYVAALRRRSAWQTFVDPAGLGGFWWAFERVGGRTTSSDAMS